MSLSPVLGVFVILGFAALTANAFPPVDFSTFNSSAETTVELITFDDFDMLIRESGLQPYKPSSAPEFDLSDSGLIPVGRSGLSVPLRYTFGARDPAGNDYLVSEGASMKGSSNAEDMLLTLDYYASFNSFAPYITYVEINVVQSSHIGEAYIASGGINERVIKIYITASKTKFLSYRYKVYAKKLNKI